MSTIAVIGLGVMGGPMAANLVSAGHTVRGYNRSRGKVDALVAAGGVGATSVAEAVEGADIVVTMLPDSPDVEEVVLGADGVFAQLTSGAVLIDMSTIRPDTSIRIAEEGARRGFGVLDAPVSGGEQGAVDGTLSIMVGGDRATFEQVKPVLEALGTTIVYVGSAGSGQTVKAANQLIVAGTIELVSEALVFLEASGVDTESAVSVLSGGLAGSAVLERKAPGMRARTFEPGFRIDLHDKDLAILRDAARTAGVVLPVGALVAELMAAMRAQGRGGLDHSALLLQVEALSGRGGPDPADV